MELWTIAKSKQAAKTADPWTALDGMTPGLSHLCGAAFCNARHLGFGTLKPLDQGSDLGGPDGNALLARALPAGRGFRATVGWNLRCCLSRVNQAGVQGGIREKMAVFVRVSWVDKADRAQNSPRLLCKHLKYNLP